MPSPPPEPLSLVSPRANGDSDDLVHTSLIRHNSAVSPTISCLRPFEGRERSGAFPAYPRVTRVPALAVSFLSTVSAA